MDKPFAYIITLIATFIITLISSFTTGTTAENTALPDDTVSYIQTAVSGDTYYDYKVYQYTDKTAADNAFLVMFPGGQYAIIKNQSFIDSGKYNGYHAWYEGTMITHVVLREKDATTIFVITVIMTQMPLNDSERLIYVDRILNDIIINISNGAG